MYIWTPNSSLCSLTSLEYQIFEASGELNVWLLVACKKRECVTCASLLVCCSSAVLFFRSMAVLVTRWLAGSSRLYWGWGWHWRPSEVEVVVLSLISQVMSCVWQDGAVVAVWTITTLVSPHWSQCEVSGNSRHTPHHRQAPTPANEGSTDTTQANGGNDRPTQGSGGLHSALNGGLKCTKFIFLC